MCDIIWCKKEINGKPCNTVNYLDPYCFWNWEGKINCAECGTVYYIHMIQGFMYKGPEERPGEEPDIMPLYADKPLTAMSTISPEQRGERDHITAYRGTFTLAKQTWSSLASGENPSEVGARNHLVLA